MAVEVKYVVIREGEEKMSFTSNKEADAYDKMLDTADLLETWVTNYRPHRSSGLNPKRKMPHTRPEATCAPDNLYHAFS